MKGSGKAKRPYKAPARTTADLTVVTARWQRIAFFFAGAYAIFRATQLAISARSPAELSGDTRLSGSRRDRADRSQPGSSLQEDEP